MNSPKCRIEFLYHLAERLCERRPPPDKHVIMAGAQLCRGREPYDLPQAAAHAIALYRIAHLLRHRESDAHRPVVRALERLQHECPAGRFDPGGGSPKVRPAFQTLHGASLSAEGAPVTH
jgi:hypothetical protein